MDCTQYNTSLYTRYSQYFYTIYLISVLQGNDFVYDQPWGVIIDSLTREDLKQFVRMLARELHHNIRRTADDKAVCIEFWFVRTAYSDQCMVEEFLNYHFGEEPFFRDACVMEFYLSLH